MIHRITPMLAMIAAGALTVAPGLASAADDAPRGKTLFARCAICHATAAQAPRKLGPHLDGIVGRKSAQVAGFKYSPAMQKAALKWDEATLDRYIAKPGAVVPGTSMVFPGIAAAPDRKALIAYLRKPK